MILTASEIQDQVSKGSITLDPFHKDALNPNSYNYRLGSILSEINDYIIDPKSSPETTSHIIPEEGFVLQPNKLYLGHTLEAIGSKKYVPSLIGRSSLGRLGLFLQITADLGQLGDSHSWTLELKVVQPLRVYPNMKIGQVSFWKPSGKISQTYTNGYTLFSTPRHSKFHDKEKL